MFTDLDRRGDRTWANAAVADILAEAALEVDTPILPFPLPPEWGVSLWLKDESAHPTGSLKHRLARSLMLYGLCNGWITEGTTLVEASSGSTAVSLAWFAQRLGLPFVAVLPKSTSAEKIDLISSYGGTCHFVDVAGEVIAEAERLALATGGHYVNQFAHAERATDWRGNNNIAESIFAQLDEAPTWIVVGAGTGGTSATLGRYIRYRGLPTCVAVVDPEGSAFFDTWRGIPEVRSAGSAIEGIGRPTQEPSFLPRVIDRMMQVPDACSVATMRMLCSRLGICAGPSTGTALFGALYLVREMVQEGRKGSVVSLICDRGDRYADTYYDDDWVRGRGWDLAAPLAELDRLLP